jgi:Protein tyrosine and serine/threonine kinase
LQEEDSFLDAVSNMSRLRHPNIIPLVGYCVEHGQRLLVYEYVGNGTLHEVLHFSDDTGKRLNWNARVKIALGTARALEYVSLQHTFSLAGQFKLQNKVGSHLKYFRMVLCVCAMFCLVGSNCLHAISGLKLFLFGYDLVLVIFLFHCPFLVLGCLGSFELVRGLSKSFIFWIRFFGLHQHF